MKAINIKWNLDKATDLKDLPTEVELPRPLIRHICHKDEIVPEYNLLMGYMVGQPKKWWYGIKGITFIFMGGWSDAYIGYDNYAMNAHNIEDIMWDNYNHQYPAPPYTTPEYKTYETKGFIKFMQEHEDVVFSWIEYYIDQMYQTVYRYLSDTYGEEANEFEIVA